MFKKIPLFALSLFFIILSCSKDDATLELNEETDLISKSTIEDQILVLTNNHRKNIGKSCVVRNAFADKLAKEHTEYMISQQKISHANFDDRFLKLQQEFNAKAAGENVAAGYTSAEKVMEAWLNSDGHKANIEGNFTHIGIAAVKDSKGKYYFTQLFYR